MNIEQICEYARDYDVMVDYEAAGPEAVVIRYEGYDGRLVVVLATRDGQHRVVMVDGHFAHPQGLRNRHQADYEVESWFDVEETSMDEWLERTAEHERIISEFLVSTPDEEIIQAKVRAQTSVA